MHWLIETCHSSSVQSYMCLGSKRSVFRFCTNLDIKIVTSFFTIIIIIVTFKAIIISILNEPNQASLVRTLLSSTKIMQNSIHINICRELHIGR